MAGYICALPLLFFVIKWLIPSLKISDTFLKVYFMTFVVVCSILMAANLNVYQEWGTKLPYRIISTLIDHPYEAYISSASTPFVIPVSLLIINILCGWLLINLISKRPIALPKTKWYSKLGISVVLFGVLFLFIRSGLQTTPLNPSMAYFSTKPILNHAAVNTEWNLLSDFLHNINSGKNPYNYMDEVSAQKEIAPYINTSKSIKAQPIEILNQERPNVVLIILESYTADLIKSLGGEAGISPNFEKLVDDGLLFTNVYAASDRTDKGIVAIMSGFPSQATKSIIKNVNKLEYMSALGQNFFEDGYRTTFFHGGASEFYNFKSYMLSHSIQEVVDQYDFPVKDVLSKWGAFDHLTFQKQIDSLNVSPQPFFSTLLTLSNHEPFDLPNPPKFGSKSTADLFRSTAFYTDSALYDYIEKAKKTDWYKNTLFVIVADHGHRLPLEKWDSFHPNRYRIPFLLFGDVLKDEYRGQTIDKIGSQVDIPSTLLHQLKMNTEDYYWSKDLLDPNSPPFAFFSWDDGFGVVTPQQTLTFDNVGRNTIYLKNQSAPDSTDQKLKTIGQAYMQEVYKQYLEY